VISDIIFTKEVTAQWQAARGGSNEKANRKVLF
jgi:hypothetical protein